MTVCMEYPAITPKWESRKTPPRGGWKAMLRERLNTYKFLKGDIAYEEKQI